eukprot:2209859-Rhodomonas_salina.3
MKFARQSTALEHRKAILLARPPVNGPPRSFVDIPDRSGNVRQTSVELWDAGDTVTVLQLFPRPEHRLDHSVLSRASQSISTVEARNGSRISPKLQQETGPQQERAARSRKEAGS